MLSNHFLFPIRFQELISIFPLDSTHVFYNGFTTNTYGINASYLGPTLLLNKGDSINIHVNNQLMDTTTLHWHGMHVSPMNDGGPHNYILPGGQWNPNFKVRDHASLYWYHPHLHMMTEKHVTLGAAGLVIVRDSIEASLNLPRRYGVDDYPLVIQTKCFDNNKQIVVGTASDSAVMVNGTIKPFLNTPAQIIRFRILNASTERVLNLGLTGNKSFSQIGSDGGLLNQPVSLTRLRLAPGERAEILIDFNGMNGQSIDLISYAAELPNATYGALQPGMGQGQTIPGYAANILNGNNFTILNFQIVTANSNSVTTIPVSLVSNFPYSLGSANTNRTLTFSPVVMGPNALNGGFLINNTSFDMNVINYTIPYDNIEVWTLTNQSPIAHPFHIHDVQFYITEINGTTPPPNMQGRKDVVLVPATQTVKFITKFETFCDDMMPYMYHCHMLPHEDDGMMGQFVVQCPSSNSIIENDIQQFKCFPNPFDDVININTDDDLVSVHLVDLSGREIFSIKTEENYNSFQFNTTNLHIGTYFVIMNGKSKRYVSLVQKNQN
jgi:blue copper oxidase